MKQIINKRAPEMDTRYGRYWIIAVKEKTMMQLLPPFF